MNKYFPYTLCLACGMPMMLQAQSAKKERPNLLVVMADQFRGNAMGFRGVESVKTPNFDKFAKQAVVFNQAVSGYPVSSPARGMFLSGAYPHSNGVIANCQSQTATQDVELKEDMVCWSDVLRSEGYNTAYIGKWHLDKPYKPYVNCANNWGAIAWNEWCPPERRHGFDYWTAYGTYDYHLNPLYWGTDDGRDDFYYVNQWGPIYEVDQAIGYLESISGSDKPFAMMISMNPPHTAYELVPDRYKQLYADLNVDSIVNTMPHLKNQQQSNVNLFKTSIKNYYACITGVDEQFGRIIQELKDRDLFDNTIIVFVSDHGDAMGMHGVVGKNVFYEEAMRVPFLIAWGNELKPRQDNDLMISLEDFCPTILSMMGLTDKIPATVQTRDLSKQVMGSKEGMPESQMYMQYSNVNETGKNLTTGARGLRTKQYTYAVRYNNGKITEEFLFDREKDPYQMNNIAKANPDVVQDMKVLMKTRMVACDDPACSVFKDVPTTAVPNVNKSHVALQMQNGTCMISGMTGKNIIEVCDLEGRKVTSVDTSAASYALSLKEGAYIVRVMAGGANVFTQKIFVDL